MEGDGEEKCIVVKIHEDEFSGLIRNIASDFFRDKIGGTAGDILGNVVGSFDGRGGKKEDVKAFTIYMCFLAKGGSTDRGHDQRGGYGGGGYDEGRGYGGPFYDGYGSGGYSQGGFGSGYEGGAPFGFSGGGYDSGNRFENRGQKNDSSGAFGLVGDLIGGILDGGPDRRGSGGCGYDSYNRKKPEKIRKFIFAIFRLSDENVGVEEKDF
ncbi:unnamed protein product [Litomosoides sigmodontis]|uniref:Uncharacterized protein n=1 Tax=Litomosoides sigmodontis TaxID=42156 RepID=A0A3P6T0C0_LITSI|nr:unnamed protein product [Litomosoides sigmodontis]